MTDRYDLGRAHGIAQGRADALRDVLALIDRQAMPVLFVEGTAEMRGAAAVLLGMREEVVRMASCSPAGPNGYGPPREVVAAVSGAQRSAG